MAAAAQAPDATFTSPASIYSPGQVYALGPQQADGKRVIAGDFTRVNGLAISNLVRLDAAGNVDQAFSQAVGPASIVYRVRSLPSGQYLLGAYDGTVTAGGITRSELLRLNANGTADASFDPGSGPGGGTASTHVDVKEFAAQPDGKVVVTGTFSTFNNVPAPGIVRLNIDGSVDTGFNVGSGLAVYSSSYSDGYAVAVQTDGKILLGGQFETFNGQPASCLVRLTATGSVDPTFTSALGPSVVESIVLQPDGKILVSGSLVASPGFNGTLARLLPSGALDPGFSASGISVGTSYNDVPMVLQPDGKILVSGGYFGQSSSASQVTRLNANGSQDPSFQVSPGPSSRPFTIGLQADGTVLVGGRFDTFDGTESGLKRLTSVGASDAAFAPTLQVPGTVAAVLRQPDGKYLLGGNFTEINGQAVHRLARLTATGVLEGAYSSATGLLPGPVSSLALQPDGNVLAGTTRGVRRFLASGAPDASFTQTYATNTSCLALQPDGKVLVGGYFSFSSGSTLYKELARFTSSGALDPTFIRDVSATVAPGAPTYTNAVLVQADGRIIVGGRFSTTSGASTCRVVRYEPTGALDPTFNNASNFSPNSGSSLATNRIYSIVQQPDGNLLVGGNFRAVDGTPRQGVARLSTAGQLDPAFAPNSSLTGTVYSVALQPNGRVLLGGTFAYSGAAGAANNLVRVLANGQTDATFTNVAQPNDAVRSMLVQPDGRIMLAGSFTTIGSAASPGVARLGALNVLQVAAPAAIAARTAAWPVPAHEVLHIAPDASAYLLNIELLDALGRQVRCLPATGAAEITLNTESLPAGMYLLRVNYAVGSVTRRLAVQ
ncbi:hypothetical protein GCM10022409_21350 [Hymenobacter glaciei]|uniref:Secretion system C-terminal sorting domain-containing protein n=2 Tax=Hymenobacter glaciei TaxID=877209 RepID=A0ABP7U752_9BACT